jgi:septum site-determining protein MinD
MATVGPTPPGASSGSRLIVVFGTKGGVGKTVIATNLAVSLGQQLGRPVCLIDLEVLTLGDVARMLKLNPQHAISELLPYLANRAAMPKDLPLDGMVTPHPSGVHVLPCVLSPGQPGRVEPRQLAAFFGWLKESGRYPYIVVDGGRSFTDQLIAAFDAANLILLVGTPDIISLHQAKWMVSVLEDLQFPASMVRGVLNRADSRGGVASENVKNATPVEVIGEIPSDGRMVGSSINEGIPLVTAYAATRVADAFRKLAETLIAHPQLYVPHRALGSRQAASPAPSPDGATGWLSRIATEERGGPVQQDDEVSALKRRVHGQLVEELELKKLDLAALSDQGRMRELRQKTERVITNLLAREVGGLVASQEVRARLVKEIADEALGLGPLEELLDDPEVTDILVNSKDQIYIERRGKLELTNKRFVSDEQVRTVIERIVAPVGRRVDEANPMVDARLPDGSRVNAVIPPLSLRGSALSIRKFGVERLTLETLIRYQTLNEAMAQFLRACIVGRKNVIISGGTGSGKTTFMNVLSAFIPGHERIITLEDAAELKLAQTHWISLEARPPNIEGKGAIGVRDLFRNALRMRPDRIIIGECRGEETLDMLQAMNTGHDGSLTTVHANSPKDVISRLDSMVLMSRIELPVRAIREMVASAIHLIVHTARLSDGTRKVTSISELVGITNETDIVMQDLFVFRQTGIGQHGAVLGEFVATGKLPACLDELKIKGIPVDPSIFSPQRTPPSSGEPRLVNAPDGRS